MNPSKSPELKSFPVALGDGEIEAARLPPDLLASWERSKKHGLRRQDQALFNHEVSNALARRVCEENHRLLNHASPEMVRLYSGLNSSRWVVLCVNPVGEVVCSVGDRASAPRQIRAVMHAGRRLAESELGTTAPGCAIEAGKPIVVSHGEHYLHELSNLFCACEPIFGGDGSLAGAVDITSVDVKSVPLASEMVGVAARVIENSLLAEMEEGVLRIHCDDRLLRTPYAGMLAVTRDGRVTGGNRTARQLLGLGSDEKFPEAIERLFDSTFSVLVERARRGGEHARVRTHAGALAFLDIEFHQKATRARSRATVDGLRSRHTLASGRVFVVNDEGLQNGFQQALSMFRHGLPTLLEGETGTGKELFARALHELARPRGPFVAVNCAAIPDGLIDSELFGYVGGAFTGGRKGGSSGKIEQANGGVLFLDEIGDMPLAMQTRLLRVVQERVVTRIGGRDEMPVDILVLSATHQRLAEMVQRKQFREDLYYRLNGFTLQLPPLRKRADLPDIARELLFQCDAAESGGRRRDSLDEVMCPAAFVRVIAYGWPGNIRQLEQTLRGIVALRGLNRRIELDDLPEWLRSGDAVKVAAQGAAEGQVGTLEAAQDAHLRTALREHGGNMSATARALGISRTTVYNRLKRAPANEGAR